MAIKRREELTIADSFVFGSVMQNESICRQLIEAVLEEPVDHVEIHHSEHGIVPRLTGKGVRLDVYLRGHDGVAYDVEMQNDLEPGFERRLGYYRSALDVDAQNRGVDYEAMCDVIVIFFARFDPFGHGLVRYDCETRVLQADRRLEDGSRIVILCSKGKKGEVDERVRSFLSYMEDAKIVADGLTQEIDAEVKRLRMNDDWYDAYMRYQLYVEEQAAIARKKAREEGLAEGRAEGRAEGLAEGRAEGRAEGLSQGIEKGRAQGIDEGRSAEREINLKLVRRLEELGRTDELARALKDEAFRDALLDELGIV